MIVRSLHFLIKIMCSCETIIIWKIHLKNFYSFLDFDILNSWLSTVEDIDSPNALFLISQN